MGHAEQVCEGHSFVQHSIIEMDPDCPLQEVLDLDTSSNKDDQISLPLPHVLDQEIGSDSDHDAPSVGAQCDAIPDDLCDSPPEMETSVTEVRFIITVMLVCSSMYLAITIYYL